MSHIFEKPAWIIKKSKKWKTSVNIYIYFITIEGIGVTLVT